MEALECIEDDWVIGMAWKYIGAHYSIIWWIQHVLSWEDPLIFGWELCVGLNMCGFFMQTMESEKDLLGILMNAEQWEVSREYWYRMFIIVGMFGWWCVVKVNQVWRIITTNGRGEFWEVMRSWGVRRWMIYWWLIIVCWGDAGEGR